MTKLESKAILKQLYSAQASPIELPSCSFPYGGMENPCLTFATPMLLAGDKSLANVIAHEIAHSWTGNLVINYNFEHFWLNEGFTVFTERKIIGRLGGGEPARAFAVRKTIWIFLPFLGNST